MFEKPNMEIFVSKSKTTVEACCREFYDSELFRSEIWPHFLNTVLQSITEVDQSCLSIDKALFKKEMTGLRMELFSLEWANKFKQEHFTIPQSFFTRRYLNELGEFEIWDIMGKYNEAIALSAKLNADNVSNGSESYIDYLRATVFDKWCQANLVDSSTPSEEEKTLTDCVARVANRIGADTERADGIAIKRLAARLAERLDCDEDLETDVLYQLHAVLSGFSKGAQNYLKFIKLRA